MWAAPAPATSSLGEEAHLALCSSGWRRDSDGRDANGTAEERCAPVNSKKITSRELLQAIGLAHHSGTMIVPYMMIAPATTDPKAAQIIMLVRALQTVLYQ